MACSFMLNALGSCGRFHTVTVKLKFKLRLWPLQVLDVDLAAWASGWRIVR
jgi:hypothetical protein